MKIYEVKGRLSDNLLIVYIFDIGQFDCFISYVFEMVKKFMKFFWLGVLIFVLLCKFGVLLFCVIVGFEMVVVRMLDYLVVLVLISLVGLLIAVLSVNLLGKFSLMKVEYVVYDLNGCIVGIVDGGVMGIGVELIVFFCVGKQFVLFCLGGVIKEQIEFVVGLVFVDKGLIEEDEVFIFFGMKYIYYVFFVFLVVVDGGVWRI